MSIFKKVKGAKPSEGGAYFTPGKYTVMINRLKNGETRQGDEFAAIECIAVESNTTDPKPGMPASCMIMGKWDGAGSMLVDVGMAVGEAMSGEKVSADEVDEAGLEALFADDQPAAGVFLSLTVLPPKPGKKFCPHRWRALDKAETKRVAELAKKLGITPSAKAA